MIDSEMTQPEKIEVLNKAKPFIKEVRRLLDKIDADLNSENSNIQMNGAFHAIAVNKCFEQYSDNLMELFEEIEKKN